MRGDFKKGLAALAMLLAFPAAAPANAPDPAITLGADDVIPTANDWIALPSIRARDGALENFNVLSMRYRGLLEASGPAGTPLISPFFTLNGQRRAFTSLHWSLKGYWVPIAYFADPQVIARLTWVTPPGYRAAILRLELTNTGPAPIKAGLGADLVWGATRRVTYSPEPLGGVRTMKPAPWDKDMQIFAYGGDDAAVSWAWSYAGTRSALHGAADAPGVDAVKEVELGPGQTLEMHFVLAAGIEEYGASKTVTVVEKAIDRIGLDGLIEASADEAMRHTRSTGNPALDLVMNRNFLFTSYYAWGRTLDTEQLVGVTSRSNRYYVSAAYWDRDAMLWSFPALLDTDTARAREALDHALGVQGRNAGVHSRYIDGVVLEDGFELDELVAPLLALTSYVAKTGDTTIVAAHRERIAAILATLAGHRDAANGLYDTFQDAQDEYIKRPFQIYDNALVWKTLLDMAALDERLGQGDAAAALRGEADALKAAIFKYGTGIPPGGTAPILAVSVDGKGGQDFADVPPGSLMKLPALGFLAEDDPLFQRTYAWLHGPAYRWSFAGQPYALPGSYRLPFTTSWLVADHLRLNAGREQARKVLLGSPWDGGIVTEGVDPQTGRPDKAGLAFATAAGYVAHATCAVYCTDGK